MKEMITPAPDRLLVGDDVGGDDGLAVPRTHRVQNAVEEGERGKGQRAGHGIVGLEALDACREHALQALLLVEHPGEQAPERPARLEWRRDRRWTEGGRRRSLGRCEGRDRSKLCLRGLRDDKEGDQSEQGGACESSVRVS